VGARGQSPIVVNWQAPAARPFYTATVAEPQGVALRRRFRTEGRRLLDLDDEPLDGSARDVVLGVADIPHRRDQDPGRRPRQPLPDQVRIR